MQALYYKLGFKKVPNIEKKQKLLPKGFSLLELIFVISIISILIGIIVQITLLYHKFNREWGLLSSTAIEAKEIAIQIETNMITSSRIGILQNDNNDTIILDKTVYRLFKKRPKKIIEISYTIPYVNISRQKIKNIQDEIYWKVNYKKYNFMYVYDISFYIYNKYAKKYRDKNVRKLVYFIVIYRYILIN